MNKILLAVLLSLSSFTFLNVQSSQAHGISPTEKISMEKAKRIALQQVKGKIVDAEIEKEDGITKYEIVIQSKDGWYEVEIDRASGKVLEVDKEGSSEN